MRATARIKGAAGAALSRGPGYEEQPLGRKATYRDVGGYFLDLRKKAMTDWSPRVNARGEVHQPGPTGIAQRALGFYEHHLYGGSGGLERFHEEAEDLLERSETRDGMLLWPYDVDVPKYGVLRPWYSCM